MSKTITVPNDLWNRLWDLKRKKQLTTLAEVITELLNRDEQGERK